ncbi:MAG TPA: hypothetical protein VNM91_11795 [Dehalococcoidia bacterium]|nr:hypothetical protein [Dehalococcoidia bacterium]
MPELDLQAATESLSQFVGEGQPASSATASAPETPPTEPGPSAPPAGEQEGERAQEQPAEGEAEKPAEGGEEPAELDDETRDALIRLYGDKFRESPEYRAMVEREAQRLADQRLAALQREPQADPVYRQLSQQVEATREQAGQALAQLRQIVATAANDGVAPDPEQLTQTMVNYARHIEAQGALAHHADSRAAFHALETIFEQEAQRVSSEGVAPEVIDEINERWNTALQTYTRLERSPGVPRSKAIAEFARLAIPALRDVYIAEGERRAMQRAEQMIKDKVALARSEALKQARAEEQARRNPPPQQQATPGQASTPVAQQIRTQGWRQAAETMRKAGIIR